MEKNISAKQLREMFLKFFKDRGHAEISSASIIPENDPTVLFTTAGMHPLVPYLMGEKHPSGTRITDVQKCIRTGDIDEVGDDSHLTFFEMLGNWSLGDYFKKEAIAWSIEFLTSENYLGIDKNRLAFSIFEGDDDCPKDEETYNYWIEQGIAPDHLYYLPKKNNWWGPAGLTGPCGPDTEMFIITDKEKCSEDCSPACDCGRFLEIWNDVFMQYNKQKDGSFIPLEQKNVDTGMGLERTVCVLNNVKSVYDTDIFSDILSKIEELSGKEYKENTTTMKDFRIIADHIRTATIILGDENGVSPSNVDQGYVLRRLIRRAVRFGKQIGIDRNFTADVAEVIIEQYKEVYPELVKNKSFITEQLTIEEERFAKTLEQGTKEFDKLVKKMIHGGKISGRSAFHLYDTFGFPIEMTMELAKEENLEVDVDGFDKAFKKHQELSKSGAEQKFKGGLADQGDETAKLHTATHLLQAALRQVLGDEVAQKGSNITAERLRFDFSFGRKVTKEELDEVERIVNDAISKKIPISLQEMTVEEAKNEGAIGLFASKYGERVKVYTMGDVSKEICGGPHANNTGDLVKFKIKKEQSSSSGVRRIKAVIGDKA